MVSVINPLGLNIMLWATIFAGIVGFILTIYGVYLNFRQAKVTDQMKEVIALLQDINETLRGK